MAAKIKKSYKRLLYLSIPVILAEIIIIFVALTKGRTVALLQPAGTIAEQQKDLILFAAGLGLLVIIPVFGLLFFILWRYRDGNVKAKYRPEWDGSKKLELTWWGIPFAIIFVLAIVAWNTSHSLDPFRPLNSDVKPLRVQVVALQWKWLFIYPDHNIATVNYLQIPEDTPINFEITADAPMNSFWIPQLGGQVYAMSGMVTKLHLMADQPGNYYGSSANISGEGFSNMKFTVESRSAEDFQKWAAATQTAQAKLSNDEYTRLAQPETIQPVTSYHSPAPRLFDTIVMKYMSHGTSRNDSSHHDMTTEGM